MISQFGKIRILFEMQDFHGWKSGALWRDVQFDVKHFKDIERVAILGEKAWEHGTRPQVLIVRPLVDSVWNEVE